MAKVKQRMVNNKTRVAHRWPRTCRWFLKYLAAEARREGAGALRVEGAEGSGRGRVLGLHVLRAREGRASVRLRVARRRSLVAAAG